MKKILSILTIAFSLQTNAQIITTIGGGGSANPGNGGQATAAQINFTYGEVFDATGNIYFADWTSSEIRKINSSGILSVVAGDGTHNPSIPAPGSFNFSGDGGQATAAKLNEPCGIATDAIGNIYFVDQYNLRVRKINNSGIITTIAGGGTTGLGDGGQATAAKIYSPHGIALDGTGNLYFTEQSGTYNLVRKINSSGIITTVAGDESATSGGFWGDGGQATSAKLYGPQGITFDATGNLYIADRDNNRIRMVNTSGIITTVAGNGTAGFSGDGTQATTAELNNPYDVAVDAAGNLYIADGNANRIRLVNTAGVINTIVGNGTAGSTGDGGQASAAEISSPHSVDIDPAGNLYIGESNRIRKVTCITPTLSLAGTNYTICNGATQTFTVSGANTYTWSAASSTLTGSNTANPIANPTTTTVYSVTGTSSMGCANFTPLTLTVTVNPIPTASFVTQNACLGDSSRFTNLSTGGTSYTWDFGDGMPTSSLTNPKHLYPQGAFIATLTVTNTYSCTNTVIQIVTVNPLPTVSISYTNVTCDGLSNGSVGVAASGGTRPYGYTWSPGNYTDSTITNLPANSYYCTINDNKGCVTYTMVTITAPLPINLSVTTHTNISCFGGSNGAIKTATAGGTAPYGYAWLPSGGIADSATALSAGVYTCNITDINNCTSSLTYTLAQGAALPTVSVNSTTICAGETATLTATGATTYTWSTTNNGAVISVSPTVTTNYTVTGSDNICSNTAIAIVDVNCFVGINKVSADNTIRVYPNPTNGIIFIKMINFENSSMEIYNTLGQVLFSKSIVSANESIDLENLNAGVYLLRIKQNGAYINQSNIIINK